MFWQMAFQQGTPKASPIPKPKPPCYSTALTMQVRRFTMSAMLLLAEYIGKNGGEAALARTKSENGEAQDRD